MVLGNEGISFLAHQFCIQYNKENQPIPLIEVIDDHLPSSEQPHDSPIPPSQQNEHIQQPTLLIHPSLEITLHPPIVINLDDGDDGTNAKIDEEIHNDLNFLCSSTMSLNDKSSPTSEEPGTTPSSALVIPPLDNQPPSHCTKHNWEVDDLLDG